jgi:hypothetical protein
MRDFLLILVIGCFGMAGCRFAEPRGLQSDLPSGTHRLGWEDDESFFSSLAPLKNSIPGDTQTYLVSEPTHNSGGTDRVHSLLARWLVGLFGVRDIAIEKPPLLMKPYSDFAMNSDCSMEAANQVVRTGPIEFNSTDHRDLLLWICNWNQEHPTDPVTIRGVDVAFDPMPWNFYRIAELAQKLADKKILDLLSLAKGTCLGTKGEYPTYRDWYRSEEYSRWVSGGGYIDPSEFASCDLIISQIQNEAAHKLMVENGGHGRSEIFRLARGWRAAHTFANGGTEFYDRASVRELEMSLEFDRFKSEKLKQMYIGHNVHVVKNGHEIGTDQGGWRMSSVSDLVQRLSPERKVFTIGVTGWDVRSTSRGQHLISKNPENLDYFLSQIGESLLVDVPKAFFLDQNQYWFMQLENRAAKPDGWRLKPRNHYDYLVFLKVSDFAQRVPR